MNLLSKIGSGIVLFLTLLVLVLFRRVDKAEELLDRSEAKREAAETQAKRVEKVTTRVAETNTKQLKAESHEKSNVINDDGTFRRD